MMWSSPLGAVNMLAASFALVAGAVVLLSRKGTFVHRMLGRAWVAAMLIVNASALSLYRLTGHFELFHVFALISLATVSAGVLAVVLKRRGWLMVHYRSMGYGYLGLAAAATAEAVTRLEMIHLHGATGIIAVGFGIGVLFTVIGGLVMPRLQRTALSMKS